MMQTTSKIGVQILLEALLFHGVEDLVFSPGSRNAPLVIGLVGSGKFRSVCIHDERSAAFYAMGMALMSGKPVPVLCTSGSALLNYAPAVAEAYYQRIPFLVISADRPLEWIDRGDGQTIRQNGVYTNYIDYQVSFPAEAKTDEMQVLYKEGIQNAMNFAHYGPVHINMPFEEPLYELAAYKPFNFPIQRVERAIQQVDTDHYATFATLWSSLKKKMILVGQLTPNAEISAALRLFLSDPETIILTENTSNVQLDSTIPCIDRAVAVFDNENMDFMPEGLIVIGGAVISKKIKSFLRKSNLKQVWKVGHDFPEMDTYGRLDQSFVMPPELFLSSFREFLEFKNPDSPGSFGSLWKNIFAHSEKMHFEFLARTPYSDLKVTEHVLHNLPENSMLHLGNSSVARYAQLFNLHKSLYYQCNRGTSGIDGSVSTAVGAAAKLGDKIHTLVVGDVSFFYDSNALWNNYLTDNLRIVMIHNGGGGIFEIIPGPDSSEFRDDYFVAQHNFSAEHLCKSFHVDYLCAQNETELQTALEELYKPSSNGRPKLLEVNTRDSNNAEILKQYFRAMKLN